MLRYILKIFWPKISKNYCPRVFQHMFIEVLNRFKLANDTVKLGTKYVHSFQIFKGNRNNWAIAIIHMLDRLATNVMVDEIWQSITTILSDLCKVNKALAVEIQSIIGSAWCPGQAFCNLYFTLAIPEGIKTVL